MKDYCTGELSLKVYIKLRYFSTLRFLGILWDKECRKD